MSEGLTPKEQEHPDFQRFGQRVPCEVYSRIVGYLRPLQNWHKGKRAEFGARKLYNARQALEKR
jgi:ribonucleoside-triphosphate reductase